MRITEGKIEKLLKERDVIDKKLRRMRDRDVEIFAIESERSLFEFKRLYLTVKRLRA